MNRYLMTTTLAAVFTAGSSLAAPITYVDAKAGASGNTFATGGSLADASWRVAGTSADTDQWSERTEGTDGNVFQALLNGSPTSIPELTTQMTIADAGTYNIWVFFQDNVGDTSSPYQNWVISAGLTSGNLTTYWAPGQSTAQQNSPPNGGVGVTQDSVSNAADLTFAGTAPLIADGSGTGLRNLFGVNLGQVTTTGSNETVNVYVDLLINGDTQTTRVFYDGVGYEVVPEPGSLALLAMGGLLIARRRREA